MAGAQLQFGAPRPGLVYSDRPSAYGVARRDGRLALVKVSFEDETPFYDLPGGGLDVGETEPQALIREFGEETGLVVAAGRLITLSGAHLRRRGQKFGRNRR